MVDGVLTYNREVGWVVAKPFANRVRWCGQARPTTSRLSGSLTMAPFPQPGRQAAGSEASWSAGPTQQLQLTISGLGGYERVSQLLPTSSSRKVKGQGLGSYRKK